MQIITVEAPLYRKYDRQTNPQPVYLEIDPARETISMEWNAEIGNAVPSAVWHNIILRYTLPITPTVSAADELLQGIAPLAERIIAGHTTEWDGSNHVGRLNADAQAASDELTEIIGDMDAEDDAQQVWDGDYLYEVVRLVDADTPDEWIAAKVREIEDEADAQGVVIDIDLREEMESRRADAIADREE